jgi:hypothetical protein
MSPFIVSDRWLEQLCRSQGIRYEHVSRVIVDARAGEPVLMYVTQFGDEKLLELTPPEIIPPNVELGEDE